MTTLITSDLHFAENPRDHYRFKLVKFLKRKIKKHDVKTLLILGDLTETKDRHSAWLVNMISDALSELAEDVVIYIMRGNHDAIVPTFPFFKFVGKQKNIQWINSATAMKVAGLGSCCFLPHTTDYKTDWEPFNFKKYDWVFAHATFADTLSESGFKLDGIPTEYFPKGVHVISGDIHKPQKVGCVTYVGSPYTVDFGDDFQSRVLLIDNDKLKSIPYVGPQKRLITIEGGELPPREELGINDGDIVKIRVVLGKEQYASWAEIQNTIKEWAVEENCNVHTVQPVIESVFKLKAGKRKKVEIQSDKELLSAYAKSRSIDERTMKAGLRFLRNV